MSENQDPGIEIRGNSVIIHVEGRLEGSQAKELLHRCERVLGQGHRQLVLNLSGVEFIASSGIGSLLALCEDANENGRAIRLAELSPAVQSVVELLNLSSFLPIDPTTDAAIQALAS